MGRNKHTDCRSRCCAREIKYTDTVKEVSALKPKWLDKLEKLIKLTNLAEKFTDVSGLDELLVIADSFNGNMDAVLAAKVT